MSGPYVVATETLTARVLEVGGGSVSIEVLGRGLRLPAKTKAVERDAGKLLFELAACTCAGGRLVHIRPAPAPPAAVGPAMRWGFSAEPDPEGWTGAYPTREEALAEARETYGAEGTIWLQSGFCPPFGALMPDADDIIEIMAQCAADNVGEAAEEWPDVGVEGKNALDALLHAWAEKHAPVTFWVAEEGDPPEEVPPCPAT